MKHGNISALIIVVLAFILLSPQAKAAGMNTATAPEGMGIFPQGEILKSPNFTGRVWLKMLVPDTSPLECPIGNVTFEPGCRNNWHKHPGGQILLVTGGKGLYQERGKAAQELHPGDTVTIPSQVEHWHGAAPDTWFTHLSITPNPQKGASTWLEPITQKDYEAAARSAATAAQSALTTPGAPVTVRLNATTRKNMAALFPEPSSTLTTTDPELAEVFNNFAFDEVLRYGTLDEKTRLMTILASCIASQALAEYKTVLGSALHVGITPVEIREIVYQAVPYVGMAKVHDFLLATNDILAARGVALPLESQSVTSPQDRFEKGLALQKSLFGAQIDTMHKEAPANQRHIQKYLSANCFGDHVSRKGLDVKMRELLTFSMLLSLGGCEPQLKGHIQGNAHVGNDKAALLSVVTQLLPYVGYPRALNAIRCLNDVLPEPK